MPFVLLTEDDNDADFFFCFIKVQNGLTFLAPTYPACPGKLAVKRVDCCLTDLHWLSVHCRISHQQVVCSCIHHTSCVVHTCTCGTLTNVISMTAMSVLSKVSLWMREMWVSVNDFPVLGHEGHPPSKHFATTGAVSSQITQVQLESGVPTLSWNKGHKMNSFCF